MVMADLVLLMLLPLYLLVQGKLAYHAEEHLMKALNLPIALWVVCNGLALLYAKHGAPQSLRSFAGMPNTAINLLYSTLAMVF